MEKITNYDEERTAAESAERAFDAEERRYALERHDDGADHEAERDEELERERLSGNPVYDALTGWLDARRVARELRGV